MEYLMFAERYYLPVLMMAEACLYLETFQQTHNQSQFLVRTIKPNFCCWQLTAIHRVAQSFLKTIKLRKLYSRIPEWRHTASVA